MHRADTNASIRAAYTGFGQWLRERVGGNWVIARRTKRIIERYGENVVCLSQAKYESLQGEYIAKREHVCQCVFCGRDCTAKE